MSGKEKLAYKFYDNPGCKHPEQGFACQKTPDDNPGVFRLGLLIVHSGTPVTLSNDEIRNEAYGRHRQHMNDSSIFKDHFMDRIGVSYPSHLSHPHALRVSFNVDLFCRHDPLIDSVAVSDTTCEKPQPVYYDALEKNYRRGAVDPAVAEFLSEYEHMSMNTSNTSYVLPPCLNNCFGQRYTFAVTRLAHQALGLHLKEKGVTASFLHKTKEEGQRKVGVVSVDDLAALRDGPHISASLRDPVQYANMHQLRQLLKGEEAPYNGEFLRGTAMIMNNATSISRPADDRSLRERVANAAAISVPTVTALGAALAQAMGQHPKFG